MPVALPMPALPTRKAPPLPRPDAAFIDPATGKITRAWFEYLVASQKTQQEWSAYLTELHPVIEEIRSLIP